MRNIFSILVAILLATCVFAQSPQKMSYQGVIHNANNNLVKNQLVGMKISILSGTTNGTPVYVETQSPTTNENGLISIEIGGGVIQTGTFAGINWANGTYFIKTETDPTGGTNYSITGTSQLLSVPYALYAANAGTVTGSNIYTHYIGEQFGGGVIFHLWKDNAGIEHGLILALTDQSISQVWSNGAFTSINAAAALSPWDGLNNSNAIIGQDNHTSSAAKLCLDLVAGGQSDWYLPSIQELNILWTNYYSVVKTLTQISGATQLVNSTYWSSTETGGDYASRFSFLDGAVYRNLNKLNSMYVRAVRAF